jgi:hypothetical protein
VLAVSETWLNQDMESRLTTIDSYIFLRLDRQTRGENGKIKSGSKLGVYVKK